MSVFMYLCPGRVSACVSHSIFLYMDVAKEDCFVNLDVFYVLWLKVTTTTEQQMRPVPPGNGKRRVAKCGLIKPHRVREDSIF